ncbi:helix-turn-helix domain-containing protein [Streptomyces sp. NPDC004539]|uniref:helix-turn-helix domain-containing protein n=1 Tax=Streptomyces sp. NPDC004539 TaxID=3154280 RepID=UPI0033A36A88
MTSHTSHGVTAVTVLPHLFRPAQIAEALGVSEWWVKEQARRGRIPCTRPAGAYRFTAEHFAEIVQLFEERPTRHPRAAEVRPRARARAHRAAPEQTPAGLVARLPQRLRQAAQLATAG